MLQLIKFNQYLFFTIHNYLYYAKTIINIIIHQLVEWECVSCGLNINSGGYSF